MPATNQLLDGATLRSEIGAGTFVWASSDPGTGTLPSNRIITWLEYKTYVATSGTTQFANNYCPNYQNMIDYRVLSVAAPTITSVTDTSFCDTTIPHYQVRVDFTPGNSAYATHADYDDGSGAGWVLLGGALAGGTSIEAEIPNGNTTVSVRVYHVNGSGAVFSDYSATDSAFVGITCV